MKKFDILSSKKINIQELDDEIRCEIEVLGGLDIFTDSHVQGVVNITSKICEQMNMKYDEFKKLVLCAYLHDIGKIKVPSEILQKNGKLTDEEFLEMKKHTIYGYEICMEYPNFKDLAPIVRAHHESFDGNGYPDGLKKDEIPFEASIIKVADVYDALTKRRQYKEGYKQSQALSIMIEDSKKNKMDARILFYLISFLLVEIKDRINFHKKNIKEYLENLETLHELETIYKSIYDSGFNLKSKKKLSKFNLPAGYDMSTNANILVNKQKALEKEKEWHDFCVEEYKTINKQLSEVKKIAKSQNIYENLYY